MASAPDLLTQYGLAVIFVWAFAVQAGAPAPAVPMLLGAGALSGTGRMNLAAAIAAAMAATVVADVVWYWLGRAHGTRVLELLCRFSLRPGLSPPWLVCRRRRAGDRRHYRMAAGNRHDGGA